jgi:predicted nucleotidyltransferase
MSRYEKEVDQATNLLEDLAATNSNSASTVGGVTVELIANHTAVLTQLMSQVPPQARGAIQHAIDVSQNDKSKALNALQSIPPKGKPSSAPRATNTPTATPANRTRTPTPLNQTNPSDDKTPPGQIRTPPGQISTPPGQNKTPPGQISTPPGQANTPPGQINPPPGQVNTPPGQINPPPGPSKPDPTKGNKPP